jgi:hypothetical protein
VIVSLKDCTALYFSAQKYANDELLIYDRSSLRSAPIALINLVDMEKGKELLSGTAFQSFRGGPAAFVFQWQRSLLDLWCEGVVGRGQ